MRFMIMEIKTRTNNNHLRQITFKLSQRLWGKGATTTVAIIDIVPHALGGRKDWSHGTVFNGKQQLFRLEMSDIHIFTVCGMFSFILMSMPYNHSLRILRNYAFQSSVRLGMECYKSFGIGSEFRRTVRNRFVIRPTLRHPRNELFWNLCAAGGQHC